MPSAHMTHPDENEFSRVRFEHLRDLRHPALVPVFQNEVINVREGFHVGSEEALDCIQVSASPSLNGLIKQSLNLF